MRYVIADIEATGLGPEREMIELALITYVDGRVVDVFETLIQPPFKVSAEILNLTGISQRQLDLAPRFYEVADKVLHLLQDAVFVSHNVEFDWAMLERAFIQMGKSIKCKTLCTLKLSQEMIPGLKSYTLDDLCRFFNIKNTDRHRALPDAQAAMKLFLELKDLASTPRGGTREPRFLPQHESFIKRMPRAAGVMYLKDAKGVAFQIEAADDLYQKAIEILSVRPEARELLSRTEHVDFEVTGSELIAQFKRARFAPVKWQWMITVEMDNQGEKFFHVKPYQKQAGVWHFVTRSEAQQKLTELKKELPKQKFAWSEGGKSKQEIMALNRVIDEIVMEARFPCANLLLWGPGRTSDEWSYVLVRDGHLHGWTQDTTPPEVVLENPESVVTKKSDATLEALAVRYLREHREKRFKRDQWRELKEL